MSLRLCPLGRERGRDASRTSSNDDGPRSSIGGQRFTYDLADEGISSRTKISSRSMRTG